MSEAFARQCKGDAYILSNQDSYLSLRRAAGAATDSLWTTAELKVLQQYKLVTRLLWVKVSDDGKMYGPTQDVTDAILKNTNIPTLAENSPVTAPFGEVVDPRVLSFGNFTSNLNKRDACAGTAQREYGYDYFG
jgi:hypothetical protein